MEKALGTPRRTVTESSLVDANVSSKDRTKIPVKLTAENIVLRLQEKNMEDIAASIGNRPLHGVRQLVKMASKRSLGESMILQPTTPAALHPSPMLQVSACLPHASHA